MKQSKLLLAFGFAAFAFVGLSFVASPNAKAALDGTNDPILYVEQNPCVVDCESNTTVSNVVTTIPDGNGEIVAASSDTYVSTATISAPTSSNSHDVIYSSDAPTCYPVIQIEITDLIAQIESACTSDNADVIQAQINKVTIDANRNPTGAPTTLVTLPTLVDATYSSDTVYNLSYAPDSSSVVASRNSIAWGEGIDDYLATLEKIDTITGDVTTIVDPACDLLLRGGYGANGTIYFSKSNYTAKGCFEDESFGSNIWYITENSTEALQLTFDEDDSSNVAEYYIDASPDNSLLLVVDANTCSYPYTAIFNAPFLPYGGCAYYYVNIADGSLTAIPEMNELFVPKFFSPDGLSLIGTLYPVEQIGFLRSFDPTQPSTAIALRSDLANPVAITNLVGIQEWAPGVVVVPTTTPVTTVGATLPSTGANTTFVLAFALALIVLGGATVATASRRQ